MPFLAKLDLDANSDARRSRRFLAHRLDVLLVGNDRRFDIIIHNISETGFLAEFSSELNPGDIVGLQLARIGFVEARVVRKLGMGHGCQFLVPVPADVVQETIAASVSFGEGASRGADSPGGEEADREGYRRRARRERAGALVVMAVLLAVLALAGFLFWIFHA